MRIRYMGPDTIEEAALFGLTFLWLLFALIFFLGRHGAAPKAKTTARSNTSRLGITMQMIAYAIVYTFERPYFTPIVPMPKRVESLVLLLASAIGVASILLCYTAMRVLGKQWSLVARIVSGHELIQQGPFSIVRNPIYLAMFGLLLQAGIVVSIWQAVVPAAVLFLVGTWIRIREEEKILRQEFGPAFDEYARRVPAFIPGLL
ncbi:MAG TPA: isoprenylcysteine carboxylmethyltransferase family protein [Candidatus Acidoferrales bacterium]|nr:isoprenylcysteine carboxylmethyltransferase family protein [Candidatus Acidoferrales bacterium]